MEFFSIGRTVSIFITLLVTLERYVAIAYPLQVRTWCGLRKTRYYAFSLIIFGMLSNFPRYTSLYVGSNIFSGEYGGSDFQVDLPCLSNFEYMWLPMSLSVIWNVSWNITTISYVIEYWIPCPLLIIFNYLSYRRVKMLSEERQGISSTQKKDLQAVKMFFPVVGFMFICNIWPTFALVVIQIWGILHRETWMIMIFAVCLNSSVNLWIYYFKGTAFRSKTREFVFQLKSKMSTSSSSSS